MKTLQLVLCSVMMCAFAGSAIGHMVHEHAPARDATAPAEPAVVKGRYASRSAGARAAARARYGGSGETEAAVLRALRWLKTQQQPDGSWKNHKLAMTGLALLAFSAHGETPASQEFGSTVEKAIQYLVEQQGEDGKGWQASKAYEHAIATHAICEAYALTRTPELKTVAERGLERIVTGQGEIGGFSYGLKGNDRNDTSIMSWCAQALKAGKAAGIEVEGLDDCMRKATDAVKANAQPSGGFGYCGPGDGGLTGNGVVAMQVLGAASDPEARRGLVVLDEATFNWEDEGRFNKNYYWYHITQAKFNAGGETWNSWNTKFSPVLVKHQTVTEDGIPDADGEAQAVGFWEMDKSIAGHTDGVVMDTCLAAMMLQTYYRYPPTPPTGTE